MDDVAAPATPSVSSNTPAKSDSISTQSDMKPPAENVFSSGVGKETEGIAIAGAELPFQDVGKEINLPKEVTGAGVKVQPSGSISIPPPVQNLGVKPLGQNVTTTVTPPLPLTYDQINKGLHRSISDSLRWLSEWCIRRIKQLKGRNIKP